MDQLRQIINDENSEVLNKSKRVERIIQEIIFDSIKDSIFLLKVDKESRFRYVAINQSALMISGINRDCIGRYIEEVHEKAYADHLQKKYEQVVKQKVPLAYQERIALNNNTIIYGESIITPVIDDYGVCKFLSSITRDITETVKEKNKLIISEQKYRSLFDHNLDPIFSLDINGQFINANPRTIDITGYSFETLMEMTIFDIISNKDKDSFKSIFCQTLNGDMPDLLKCEIITKQGEILLMQIKTVPIIVNEKISGVYVIAKDITKQYKDEQTIKFMAYHDDLTGLANRSSLKEKLKDALKVARKENTKLGIMFVDLDRFKFLNDTMGHNIGDLVLKKVANRLCTIFNREDSVFRQGGDEFIVLLRDTDREEIKLYAEAVLKAFNQPFVLKKQDFFITPSIGISMFPSDGVDEETLIKNADTALYRVKARGKSHYQFYTQDMKKGTPRALKLETGLRKAIEKNELIVYYQPQIDLVSGKVTSCEALLRWDSEELGFISPGEFIPIAEETGLILSIGNWVFENVCRQIKEWEEKGYTPVKVGINLSPRQFQQPDLVETIKDAIYRNNIDPSLIEVEITEGAMQDAKEALLILNQLREIGAKISIDDFGTGYSSLSHLKRFPIDTLKIDQSFVRDLLFDEDSEAIVTTIIQMAKTLGMSVVAEGVEEEGHINFLKGLDCEKVQGFYYSRAVPADAIEKNHLEKAK